MDVQPISIFAKLMAPLGRLMVGSLKKCLENDLEDAKRIAETRAASETSTV